MKSYFIKLSRANNGRKNSIAWAAEFTPAMLKGAISIMENLKYFKLIDSYEVKEILKNGKFRGAQ